MEVEDLRERTKRYAVSIIRFGALIPNTSVGYIIGKQLVRSGTSIGAQYREAYRAKSDADYLSKVAGALQELDESEYGLELLCDSGIVPKEKALPLINETNELIPIFMSIVKKVRTKLGK